MRSAGFDSGADVLPAGLGVGLDDDADGQLDAVAVDELVDEGGGDALEMCVARGRHAVEVEAAETGRPTAGQLRRIWTCCRRLTLDIGLASL